jgi:hypothetical protein
MPTHTFTARDKRTYILHKQDSRVVLRPHDGLDVGETVHEYWIAEDDDSARCYVARDGSRYTLD